MAKSTETFPTALRTKVVAHFTAAIDAEPDAARKAALGARMGAFQSSLVGKTGAEVSDLIRQFIADLKQV